VRYLPKIFTYDADDRVSVCVWMAVHCGQYCEPRARHS
jgi:hypothetical protein